MRRLFYKGKLKDELEITGEDAHHLKNVYRAKINDEITVVDDFNSAARMRITAFTDTSVVLESVEEIELTGAPKARLTLAFCLLKGEKTDFVLQKATELGVSKIIPIISDRVIVKPDAKKAAEKLKRWEKIVLEAAKQSGGVPPEVSPLTRLDEFLQTQPQNLVFFYENEEERSLKQSITETDGNELTLLIGPEGGFSAYESERIIKAGGAPTTLGKRILRAETAAMVAVALVMHEMGEF